MEPINLKDKFSRFNEHWSPRNIARLNDMLVKTAKLHGEFVWHRHDETDELFLVHKGEVTIQFREGEVTLRPGELYVVPRGVEHRPVAKDECEVVLMEPVGTVNTGDAGGALTADPDAWI